MIRRAAPPVWLLGLGAWIAIGVADGETLTVATYNLENYGPADRMTEAGYRTAYPKPEREKLAVRRVVAALHADVLVVQEMGSEPYLEELRRDLRTAGCDYPHAMLANATDADRHVAVLSTRPFLKAATLTDLSFEYFGHRERVKRGVAVVTLATAAGELTIFGLHLKSRWTDRADDPDSALRRTAEATAVRDEVLRRFPNPAAARFIIIGDCNDTKESKPLERLLKRGDLAIGSLLPAIDAHGETWTYFYRRTDTYSRVDHILVSSPLRAAVVDAGARIYDGPGASDASDHRPVLVRFRFGE